ncbi:glycyl-radical enzyme activating protein [Vallitaleaceae bacterium 9-2]
MMKRYEELLNTKGRIFDIQRYSIHDGEGIRTIIFLKGCHFRCQWCCNPESQSKQIQTMQTKDDVKVIGKDVCVNEVMEEVLRDMAYYRHSKGGITLSGGEALLQPQFAGALLEMAKYNGLTTTIESTGDVDFSIIENYILPYLDVFLMDIKHIDGKKHEEFTGRSNARVLENAKKIAQSGQKLIIRVPVIPTFNDTLQEIDKIAAFAKTLPGVVELHLLAYHRYGVDKYKGLGRTYLLENIKTLEPERMQALKKVVQGHGLKVHIGG